MRDNTPLNDRILWFDGDSTVEPDVIADMVLKGMKLKRGIYVSEVTDEIEQFNQISDYQLEEKTENRPFQFDWNIPEKYQTMNLRKFLLKKLEAEVERNDALTEEDVDTRLERIDEELELYYTSNLNLLLRTTVFIIDTFREKNIVWGVGRGSACSSYILYLIGIHDIDSVHYDLDIRDFLR
jgi:DNA polymerase III alpha subunit